MKLNSFFIILGIVLGGIAYVFIPTSNYPLNLIILFLAGLSEAIAVILLIYEDVKIKPQKEVNHEITP